MIDKVKAFFEAHFSAVSESHPPSGIELAASAVALLLMLGKVDHRLDQAEEKAIEKSSRRLFGLDQSQWDEVWQLAEAAASDSTSLYEFTGLIHEHFDESLKVQIIEALWQVAFADGRIDKYEEHMIRKIAELTYVPHVKFVETREKVRAQQQ